MTIKNDQVDSGSLGIGEILFYQSEDGTTKVHFQEYQGTVWLTQAQISELFQKARNTITEHIQNIFTEGELIAESVCREFRHTAGDGKSYATQHYNLDLILAVGYRVRSARGIQFRQWATTTLKEYLVKGFVLDDKRLKNPGAADYFDLLLERIRDIRTTEKRFYQKVRVSMLQVLTMMQKTQTRKYFLKPYKTRCFGQ